MEYSAVTEEECVTVQDEKCEIKYDTVQVKLFFNNHDDQDDQDDHDDHHYGHDDHDDHDYYYGHDDHDDHDNHDQTNYTVDLM